MIKKLSVRDFKSIESLELDLGSLTILIGPNSAGKTNILDVFRLLSRYHAQSGTPSPVSSHEFVFGGDLSRNIGIAIAGDLPQVDMKESFVFEVSFYNQDRQLLPGFERFTIQTDNDSVKLFSSDMPQRRELDFTISDSDGRASTKSMGRHIDRLALGDIAGLIDQPGFMDSDTRLRYEAVRVMSETISQFRLYNLEPSRMRGFKPVHARPMLDVLGDNLPEVLHTLHSKYRRQCFAVIEEQLKAIVPDVSDLVSDLEGSSTAVAVRQQGNGYLVPSTALPDGLLKLVAVLTILNSPHKPPLLAIEEPENYIHPYAQNALAEILKAYSEKHQLILTTHSPSFLSNFELSDVVVVEKIDGRTKASRPKSVDGLKERLKEAGMTIGDAWYAGHLGA